MARFHSLAAALLLAVPLSSAASQQPVQAANQAPIRVSTTGVGRVTLYRILPGQGAAHNRDIVENLIPIYEEYKKAGIITGYNFFNKSTFDSAEDWQAGITVTYANWAAIDNLGAKTDAITLKHYGTAEKRAAAGQARQAIRLNVSGFYTTAQAYAR